jgi:hypothetical protein
MDRLMSDIIKQKRLPQEEHQALKCIGKAICNAGLGRTIKELVSQFDMQNEVHENFPETEKLGSDFLKVIDGYNNSITNQTVTQYFLIVLHKVALDVL